MELPLEGFTPLKYSVEAYVYKVSYYTLCMYVPYCLCLVTTTLK